MNFPRAELDDGAVFDQGAYIYDLDDLYAEDRDQAASPPIVAPIEEKNETDDDGVGPGPSGPPPCVYKGEDKAPAAVPSRGALVAKHCAAMSKEIRDTLAKQGPIDFMPHDIVEQADYDKGTPIYKLHLFGPLKDGSKAHVIVDNVDVFFDVRVPVQAKKESPPAKGKETKQPKREDKHVEQFTHHLRKICEDARASPVKIEAIKCFPIRGYYKEKQNYRRLYFNNIQNRKDAITAIRAHSYETARDDRSCYYRMVSREIGVPLAGWVILNQYDHRVGPTVGDPLCQHTFRLPVKGLSARVDPLASRETRTKQEDIINNDPWLLKDKTLVMCWDIETHTTRKEKSLPLAVNPQDKVFSLSLTVHWKDEMKSLVQIVLVDKPTNPDERWITVVCGNEENIYRAFALIYKKLAPDTFAGFNDSEYDWPFVVDRARQLDILGWMVDTMSALPRKKKTTSDSAYDWNYKKSQKIKITPESTFLSSYLKVPGCVPLDVRPTFMKLFPKSEVSKGSSLRYYLKECGLPGKRRPAPHQNVAPLRERRPGKHAHRGALQRY